MIAPQHYQQPQLTDPFQHNTVPVLLSQSELPVELQLNGVVSPHLMSDNNYISTANSLFKRELTFVRPN